VLTNVREAAPNTAQRDPKSRDYRNIPSLGGDKGEGHRNIPSLGGDKGEGLGRESFKLIQKEHNYAKKKKSNPKRNITGSQI
jgi:hypothetical protein